MPPPILICSSIIQVSFSLVYWKGKLFDGKSSRIYDGCVYVSVKFNFLRAEKNLRKSFEVFLVQEKWVRIIFNSYNLKIWNPCEGIFRSNISEVHRNRMDPAKVGENSVYTLRFQFCSYYLYKKKKQWWMQMVRKRSPFLIGILLFMSLVWLIQADISMKVVFI